jgi:hypothetical protein
MRTDYLERIGTATFDVNGQASVSLGPDGPNQYWTPKLIHVSTRINTGFSSLGTVAVIPPTCRVYHNKDSLIKVTSNFGLAGAQIDATVNGYNDTSGLISGTVLQFGESITAIWTGGYTGDIAVLNIYGESSDTPPAVGKSIPEVAGPPFSYQIPPGNPDWPYARAFNIQAMNIANPGPGNNAVIIAAQPLYTIYLHSMEWTWNTSNSGSDGQYEDTIGVKVLFDNAANINARYMDFKGAPLSFGTGFRWHQNGPTVAGTNFINGSVTYSLSTQVV